MNFTLFAKMKKKIFAAKCAKKVLQRILRRGLTRVMSLLHVNSLYGNVFCTCLSLARWVTLLHVNSLYPFTC